MEKFNLLDFIARIGEAYFAGNGKAPTKPDDNAAGKFKNDGASPVAETAAPKKQGLSTSEQAMVEMLRRHDQKSKEIDERLRSATEQKDKNAD